MNFGSLDVGDDPLLAIVAEHVLGLLELRSLEGPAPVHFDSLMGDLIPLGIRVDELDEAIAWLLQSELIIEIEEDSFSSPIEITLAIIEFLGANSSTSGFVRPEVKVVTIPRLIVF